MTRQLASMLALSTSDVVLVYLVTFVLFLFVWLAISLVIYVGMAWSRSNFDFKHDFMRKFDGKRSLPSGRHRLSFFYVAKALLGDNCIQAVFLYRIARFFATHRMRPLAEVINSLSRLVTHTDLSPWSNIAPGLLLYHGLGTVVGKGANVGRRARICHGVTIGGGATLGDDVNVWAGAQILAWVTVGDRTEVGANAVVTTDFPPDSVLVGVPARLARTESDAGSLGVVPASFRK